MLLRAQLSVAGNLRRQAQIFDNIPVGLVVWRLDDVDDARSLRLIGANPAAEMELGLRISKRLGKTTAEALPRLLDADLPEQCRAVILSGKARNLGRIRYRRGRTEPGTFALHAFPLPDRCVCVTFRNIDAHRQAESESEAALQLLHAITIGLNDASSIEEGAQMCLDKACHYTGWPVGHLLLLDEHSKTSFVPNGIWHFDSPGRFRGFRRATEHYERDPGNELVASIRKKEAQRAGLKRSFGFSVLEGQKLVAILEFSSETVFQPKETTLKTVADVAVQLGRVFERRRSADALRVLSGRIREQEKERRILSGKLWDCVGGRLSPVRRTLERLSEAANPPDGTPDQELADSVQLIDRCLVETRALVRSPLEFQNKEVPGRQAQAGFLEFPTMP